MDALGTLRDVTDGLSCAPRFEADRRTLNAAGDVLAQISEFFGQLIEVAARAADERQLDADDAAEHTIRAYTLIQHHANSRDDDFGELAANAAQLFRNISLAEDYASGRRHYSGATE